MTQQAKRTARGMRDASEAWLEAERAGESGGNRMDPPPSVPIAAGPMPSETAAAAPPLLPPGVRSISQGLRVTPVSGLSVTILWAKSGRVVLANRSLLTREVSPRTDCHGTPVLRP